MDKKTLQAFIALIVIVSVGSVFVATIGLSIDMLVPILMVTIIGIFYWLQDDLNFF